MQETALVKGYDCSWCKELDRLDFNEEGYSVKNVVLKVKQLLFG